MTLELAEQFDPDRFLDERLQKYITPNPFVFLPFNAGPRICLGQQVGPLVLVHWYRADLICSQFAYNEISFFMIRLLQHFSKFTIDMEAQPPEGRAPASWANSSSPRKAAEQIFPKSHLTMYAQVSSYSAFLWQVALNRSSCYKGGLWVRMEESSLEAVWRISSNPTSSIIFGIPAELC